MIWTTVTLDDLARTGSGRDRTSASAVSWLPRTKPTSAPSSPNDDTATTASPSSNAASAPNPASTSARSPFHSAAAAIPRPAAAPSPAPWRTPSPGSFPRSRAARRIDWQHNGAEPGQCLSAHSPYNGLLIVDKPGHPSSSDLPTSHDVVAYVRRWSGQRRIGHTGTLDPMASGVLVLCLGRATRLVEYYQGHDKQYLADIALGAATDTYDAAGRSHPHARRSRHSTRTTWSSVLTSFAARSRRRRRRTPPSSRTAKRCTARPGAAKTVQAPRDRSRSRRLDLLDYDARRQHPLRVVCSAGTYMRSLAHDLGIALGTCAHLAALRREAAGPFTLDEAHTPGRHRRGRGTGAPRYAAPAPGDWAGHAHADLDERILVRFGHGQQVALPDDFMA